MWYPWLLVIVIQCDSFLLVGSDQFFFFTICSVDHSTGGPVSTLPWFKWLMLVEFPFYSQIKKTLCCRLWLCVIYAKQNRSGVGKLSIVVHGPWFNKLFLCRKFNNAKTPHTLVQIYHYIYLIIYPYVYIIYICIPISSLYPHISLRQSNPFFGGRSWGISCVAKTLCCAKRSVCSRRIGDGSEPMKFPYDWGINIHYPLVNLQKTMENHHFLWENSL